MRLMSEPFFVVLVALTLVTPNAAPIGFAAAFQSDTAEESPDGKIELTTAPEREFNGRIFLINDWDGGDADNQNAAEELNRNSRIKQDVTVLSDLPGRSPRKVDVADLVKDAQVLADASRKGRVAIAMGAHSRHVLAWLKELPSDAYNYNNIVVVTHSNWNEVDGRKGYEANFQPGDPPLRDTHGVALRRGLYPISLTGLLKGTTDELPDRKLVVQYRVSGAPWDPAVVMWGKWRLLKEKERRRAPKNTRPPQLYHVGRDPGQARNIAARHPDVVKAMTEHYEAWHAEARKLFDRRRWITIGGIEANPMTLYSQDWVGDYCDNPRGLSQSTAHGFWDVIVDREGVYQIELRRWPHESNKTHTEGWDGPQDTGASARPIKMARLKVADQDRSIDTQPASTHATFQVRLSAGKTQLSTTFLDADGQELCSAIYVQVRRLDGAQE